VQFFIIYLLLLFYLCRLADQPAWTADQPAWAADCGPTRAGYGPARVVAGRCGSGQCGSQAHYPSSPRVIFVGLRVGPTSHTHMATSIENILY